MLLLGPDEGGGEFGPYLLERDLLDPWGNRFDLQIPGIVTPSLDVVSFGSDASPGGVGAAADITK